VAADVSGPRGGAAVAGVLAAVLAVLLGLGVAGVLTAGRAGAHAAAAGAASPAAAADPAGWAAGPGSGAAGAASPAGAATSTSKAGGHTATSKKHTTKTGTSGAHTHQAAASGAADGRRAAPARAVAGRPGTSCRRVAHIGDSTSVGLVSPLDLPDPAQRLAAQYRDVGVRHTWIDASGGRSMVEEMPGQANGYDTARTMVSSGFRGCWVIALGTNDTANVSAGSNVSRMARIQELMSVAHGAPVMWVNVKTLDPSGPWSGADMQLWNDALVQACHQYPNLRIFDWASVARDGWFAPDGIHYTPAGYAARARLIARALARAFPGSGPSAGCVIR
jgi:lysophospholipase L1-like esterase